MAHRTAPLQGAHRFRQPPPTHPVRVRGRFGEPAGDFRFAVAVAGFGLVLRDSEYRGTATLEQVLDLARGAEGRDADGERAEFVRLVE